jgi:cytochrome P450
MTDTRLEQTDDGGIAQRKRLAMERCATPREYYAGLRASGPVDDRELADGVQLVRRGDIEHALRTPEVFSSILLGDIMGSAEPVIPLNVDPPEHVRYRRLLDPLFSPKRMAALQPEVQRHTDQLIDRFVEQGGCDFSTELAVPLPCSTFLSLLGLPLDELDALVRWKDIMIRAETLVDDPDEAKQLQFDTAAEIYGRFGAEMQDRRTRPREDLITFLTQAEIDGEKLSESEILRICFLLLAAGLDTVTISLECIFAYLLDHDEARRLLVDEPGSVNALVEELLRWESPVQTVSRRTMSDVDVGGVLIAKDTAVTLALASANVDPDGLPGAESVDVRRADMRSYAFGGGPHRCLGSNLARMELRTVVRTWHDRIPEYALAPGTTLQWNGSSLRGIDSMPLRWGGAG